MTTSNALCSTLAGSSQPMVQETASAPSAGGSPPRDSRAGGEKEGSDDVERRQCLLEKKKSLFMLCVRVCVVRVCVCVHVCVPYL